MKIKFIGDPRDRDPGYLEKHKGFKAGDPDVIESYGMRFPLNEPVEVPDDSEWVKRFGGKMRGNTHFSVEEGAKSPAKPAESGKGSETHQVLPQGTNRRPVALIETEERREEIASLRIDLKALGGTPDLRWGPKRLRSEIKKRRG